MAKEKMKIGMAKSECYRGNSLVEHMQFLIPTRANSHTYRHIISGEEYPRDIVNFANQLAEIEEVVNEEFSLKDQPTTRLAYDEKKLQEELQQFSKIMDISDHFYYLAANVNMLEGARNGMLHNTILSNTFYLKKLLQAPNNEAMDKVKTPFERLPLWQRIGRQDDELAFKIKSLVKKYTPEQKEFAFKMVKYGFFPDWRELCNKEEELNRLAKKKDKKEKVEQLQDVIKDFKRINGEFDKHLNEVYADYAKELITAKERKQDLEEVPTPFAKKTLWQRLTSNEGQGNMQLVNTIKLLQPAEFNSLKDLFTNGMPSSEQMNEAWHKYHQESVNTRDKFGYERRKELFSMLLKQYGQGLLEDKKIGWHCWLTDSLPIKGQEKEEFDKMSLKEVTEKYGVQQMWTHKGIILIREKIRAAKDDPKKLAQTLIEARAIVQEKSKCFHVPLANRQFFALTMAVEYIDLSGKNHKYAEHPEIDEQFQKLFTALQPQEGELRIVKEYRNIKAYGDRAEFIKGRVAEFDKFTKCLDEVLSHIGQESQISKAKARLLKKFATKESAVQDITGGTAAAYRHADDMKKLSENGMHFKEAPQLDLKAYQRDVVGELKQKSNQRMDKLAQKRATRQSKKQGRE